MFEDMMNEAADGTIGSTIEPVNPRMEVLTQGIAVDLNTQAYWMQMNLCYPDGFVYLSFHFNS